MKFVSLMRILDYQRRKPIHLGKWPGFLSTHFCLTVALSYNQLFNYIVVFGVQTDKINSRTNLSV